MSAPERMRLTFFTVIPAPYQRDLFWALSQSGLFDLKVYYYASAAVDTRWADLQLHEYERVLSGITILPLGSSAHLNFAVIGALRRCPSDLVVISDYSAPTAQIAMRYLNSKRRPWVFWGERFGIRPRGAGGTWLRRRLQAPLNGAQAIAAIGSKAAIQYQELFPGKLIRNIPYACDLEPYARAVDNSPRPTNAHCNMLFSGQLIHRKGVDTLVNAFIRAAAKSENLQLTILGDGPNRGELEHAIPLDLRRRVSFLGFKQPPDIPPIFAAADIFVMPSRHDGWGLVVNEALGSGLPIIATDATGAAHDLVVPGVNGYIVPADDADALVAAILSLSDPERRKRFSAESRKLADNWGPNQAVLRWKHLCQELTNKNGAIGRPE